MDGMTRLLIVLRSLTIACMALDDFLLKSSKLGCGTKRGRKSDFTMVKQGADYREYNKTEVRECPKYK